MEKQNIKLLENPENTLMYFVQLDRIGYNISIQEVYYLGFEEGKRKDEYYDPGKMKYPVEYTQKTFIIHFKTRKNEKITVETDNIDYWNGLRAFDTDEHLSCGKANYPYIDFYFTTSKEKLKNFLKKEQYIEKMQENKDKLCKTYDSLMNFLAFHLNLNNV